MGVPSNTLIIIVLIYNLFWAAISSQVSTPFAEAAAVITGPFPDPADHPDFMGGTHVLGYGAAIIIDTMERIANFFIAAVTLILPFELNLYGQEVNTTGLAIFNLLVNGLAMIYFKDQILAVAEAIIPF